MIDKYLYGTVNALYICQRADRLANQLRDWVAAEGVIGFFIDEQCNTAAREDTAGRWLQFELEAKALSVGALAPQPWAIGFNILDTIQLTNPSPGRIGSCLRAELCLQGGDARYEVGVAP